MVLQFPDHFLWGSSTSAAQIETASDHQFRGMATSDGFLFERTIDHEKHRGEDAEFIAQFGDIYRCSVDWARLQPAPLAPFEPSVVREYCDFFDLLSEKGIRLMFVLNHFAHPSWFEARKAWQEEKNIDLFVDFARRCYQHFSGYVHSWNTFNEPNAYVALAYLLGEFPPHKRRRLRAGHRALRHMGAAHQIIYDFIHAQQPDPLVGIAQSVSYFDALHLAGKIPALLCDWWYNRYAAKFFSPVDFWGINYYAYLPFDPRPVTEIKRPGRLDKLGIPHDDMWGYQPRRLLYFLKYFYKKYDKPVWVTENGICTTDDGRRIQGIKDYLQVCHQAIEEGIDLRGYIHWSTFDNFEWHLGPGYRFGLVHVNLYSRERRMTKAGTFYQQIVRENRVVI